MSKQTEKVRRYQAARVRLPNITLTTVDRANLDACIVRHGTAAEAVKEALAWMLDRLLLKIPEPSRYERGEFTGEQLQSIFVGKDFADMFGFRIDANDLRQAPHEYATHITKSAK